MKAALPFCLALFLLLPSDARASTWQFSAPSCTVTFDRANIVALGNRLTNETVGSLPKARMELAGIRLLRGSLHVDDMVLCSLEVHNAWATARYEGLGASYILRISAGPDGGLVLSQNGSTSEPGTSEIYWGIYGIDASETTLIVPGASGVEIDSSYRLDSYEFQWPVTWEAQMIILKTPKGGFLLWSDDTTFRFKDFWYRRRGDRWELRFGTQNVAPFDGLRRVSSVDWRISPFVGDWTVAAAIYREWMESNLGLSPLAQEVSWAKEIRFVVIMNLDKTLLEPLSEQVNASATLLYLPNWRFHEYDRYYPDYTASPALPEFVAEAHRLGFKVMVHTNYFGVSPDHPLYNDLKAYQMRDPFTGDLLWWQWTKADPPIYIAYINPACSQWRDIFVRALKDVRERYGVDAFHLDCSWAVWNDANGVLDGLTSTQGNIELHRQLREAMPEVAFSGEGLNELTIRYERFAQRHVILGIDHVAQSWDGNLIAHLHPISAFLFCPYNVMYGYLGICNPDYYPALWHAWDASYESLGVVPTLWLHKKDELEKPGPEMKGLLAKARYFTFARPTPTFPTPDPSVKFSFATKDGKVALYRRQEFGVVLEEIQPDGAETLVAGRIENASWAKTAGSIPGWLAYNETHIFGLNATRTYVLLSGQRDLQAVRISALPENVVVQGTTASSTMFGFLLAAESSSLFDFVRQFASSSRYVLLGNGSRTDLAWGATWQAGVLTCGGISKPAIYSVPPSNGLGETVGTYVVTIPESGARLRVFMGLTDQVRPGESDGVTFTILIGDEPALRIHHSNRSWRKIDLDLANYSGRTVKVSFSVGPGPAGNARLDLAAWGDPQLLPFVPDPMIFDIFCPRGPTVQIQEGVISATEVEGVSNLRRITGHLPLTYIMVFQNATKVSLTFDLVDAPFQVRIARAGTEEEPSGYASCRPATVSCGGVSRNSLFEHPPPSGATCAHFLLDLPENPAALQTQVGIADGSLSTGVIFVVRVNLKEVARVGMLPSYWKELWVDLSPYASRTVVLSLETEPHGTDYYDWAAWGEPRIIPVNEVLLVGLARPWAVMWLICLLELVWAGRTPPAQFAYAHLRRGVFGGSFGRTFQ